MKNRRAITFAPALIGFIGLSFVTRNPRFELFHTVDVLQLLASGMCFGATLALVFASRRAGN